MPRSTLDTSAKTRTVRKRRAVQHVPADYTVLIPRRSGPQIDPNINLRKIPEMEPGHPGIITALTLTVLSKSKRGQTFEFAAGTSLWVGRGRAAGLKFDDRKMSRQHLQLDIDADAVRLFDLESLNGTRLNGEEVRVARLQDGDVIEIGLTVLQVQFKVR